MAARTRSSPSRRTGGVGSTSLAAKVARGSPYLVKELRAVVSDHTPYFLAVPRVVHIWRGAPCNAKCPMCPWGYLDGAALRPYVRSDFADEQMPEALEQAAELCGRGTLVSYMGGEPMLKRGLIDWVERSATLGLDFRFTTNGYLMTEELAERLVRAGVFNIGVSLEALDPAVNEQLRPFPNGTERTLRCIELVLAERARQRTSTSVNIKTVLTDVNLEGFVEIVEHFGDREGVMVTPQLFEAMEGMPAATKELLFVKDVARLRRIIARTIELKARGYNVNATEDALEDFVKHCMDDPQQTSTMYGDGPQMAPDAPDCTIATDNLWISDGEVKLCPHHPPIGRFGEATLKELWESEMARRIRARTRACRRLCTISCLRRTPVTHKVRTFMKLA
jgi:MoaA/NifB/PqqE/SkfB family radical SAM enzyme